MIASTYILNSAENTGRFVIRVADNKDQVVIRVIFRKKKEKKVVWTFTIQYYTTVTNTNYYIDLNSNSVEI